MESFIAGSVSGFVQIFIGHPFDTYKVWLQTGQCTRTYRWRQLYLGIRYPLYTNCLSNSILFSSYHLANRYVEAPWLAGAASGLATSLVCTPVDMGKIMKQVSHTNSIERLYHTPTGLPKLGFWYRGLTVTAIREVIANSIYFGVYHELYPEYSAFWSGGLAGVLSWLFTHPIDTIKTRFQSNPAYTMTQAYRLGDLTKGIGLSVARAFVVNSVGFYVFQNTINQLERYQKI